jgi:dTDP-4-dehydrorhamnose reductase
MTDTTVKATNKVFGIGASGLIGSRIAELLTNSYYITNLSTSVGIDITNPETLSVIEKDTEHSVVILFAAKADVDGCEKDKPLGKNGQAWKINVDGPRNVAHVCRRAGKRLLYISTDFVFSGEDTPANGYSEEDLPSPIDWYAATKFEGEKAVVASGVDHAILRVAYPYRLHFPLKKDFVHAIAGRLAQKLPVQAVTDHIMTPTYVDDIAASIERLLGGSYNGIFHVVGSQFISPYEAAQAIAEEFGYDKDLVQKTTRAEFFQGRAPRPFNLSLKNDKIEHLGIQMRTFRQGLQDLKKIDNTI